MVMGKLRQLPADEGELTERSSELMLALKRHDVMRRLADLARVPKIEKARECFSNAIFNLVLDAWEDDDVREAKLQLESTSPALSRAADALRSAKQALANLDERDRDALWWPISEVESGIDRFFEWVVRRVRTDPTSDAGHGQTSGRGQKSRISSFRSWPFSGCRVLGRPLHSRKEHWDGNCDRGHRYPCSPLAHRICAKKIAVFDHPTNQGRFARGPQRQPRQSDQKLESFWPCNTLCRCAFLAVDVREGAGAVAGTIPASKWQEGKCILHWLTLSPRHAASRASGEQNSTRRSSWAGCARSSAAGARLCSPMTFVLISMGFPRSK